MELGDHYIVTGGYDSEAPERALNTVAKYSQSGLVDYLPSLNTRRYDHACSSFISDSGETVGFINIIKYHHHQIHYHSGPVSDGGRTLPRRNIHQTGLHRDPGHFGQILEDSHHRQASFSDI